VTIALILAVLWVLFIAAIIAIVHGGNVEVK
jgi:hypothetical protein